MAHHASRMPLGSTINDLKSCGPAALDFCEISISHRARHGQSSCASMQRGSCCKRPRAPCSVLDGRGCHSTGHVAWHLKARRREQLDNKKVVKTAAAGPCAPLPLLQRASCPCGALIRPSKLAVEGKHACSRGRRRRTASGLQPADGLAARPNEPTSACTVHEKSAKVCKNARSRVALCFPECTALPSHHRSHM